MKNKKLKRILSILLFIIILMVGIVIGRMTSKNNFKNMVNQNKTESTSGTVEKEVDTQTIENTLTSAGEIAASSSEKLTLTTTKYFKTMCAEEGDIVQNGGNILQYTDGTYLTATYNCVIGEYSVPETSSICTSSNYVTVQNIETMEMILSIDESDINKIAVGQEVNIEISALEDNTYTGSITSVSGVGSYSTSGTTFEAVVQFANDGNVKIGMSASCSIVLEKAENCIAVPIEAVQTSGDQKYVVVVDDSGNTQNVNIETGISNDSYVQIISGLSGGEKIQMIETSTNSKNGGMMQGGGPMGGDGQMPNSGERPDFSEMNEKRQNSN